MEQKDSPLASCDDGRPKLVQVSANQWRLETEAMVQKRAVSGQATERTAPKRVRRDKADTHSNGFRTGLCIGLALGCVCLFAIHQFGVSLPTATMPRVVSVSRPLIATTRAMTVPAMHLFVLAVGPFAGEPASGPAVNRGSNTSQWAVTWPAQSGYYILETAALRPATIEQERRWSQSHGVAATAIRITRPARLIACPKSMNPRIAQQTSTWLSANVSALNALVAVLAEGEAARDALVAYQAASTLAPSVADQTATGHGALLKSINTELGNAFSAYLRHRKSDCEQNILAAYTHLLQLSDASL